MTQAISKRSRFFNGKYGKNVWHIWSGERFKRLILRRVSWFKLHPLNFKIYWSFPQKGYSFWNVNLLIVGTEKMNGSFTFRILNFEIDYGW